MHRDIQKETAGKCPKCGMDLVPADTIPRIATSSSDKGLGALTWKSYIPLLVIIFFILAVSGVFSWRDYEASRFSIYQSISYFMMGFFIIFSGFKLMDLKGFAEGYSTYDLLAQKIFWYGYIYPFIELGFGLFMLAGVQTQLLLWSEIGVMAFSGLGVILKLMKKEPVKCVCLGTFLKIPLTNVTLVEDFGMAILALILSSRGFGKL